MEQATQGADPGVGGHAFGPSHHASSTAQTPVPAIVASAGVDGSKEGGIERAELLDEVDRRGSGLSDASDGENITDRLSTFTIRKQTSYR